MRPKEVRNRIFPSLGSICPISLLNFHILLYMAKAFANQSLVARLSGRTTTHASKKASEKALGRALGKGS